MRFRFSLRWVLISFALLSIGFYLFFVRPTVIANGFVAAVKRGDFAGAEALATSDDPHFLTRSVKDVTPPHDVEVSLAPQTWHGLFHGRRTIVVYVVSRAAANDASGCGIEVAAGISGVYRVAETYQQYVPQPVKAIILDADTRPQ